MNKNKKLGQYFLKNKTVIEKIITALDLKKSDTIIEIGPGTGALTLPLAKRCRASNVKCQIIGIEKDQKLAENLVRQLADRVRDSKLNIKIIKGDALRILSNPKSYMLNTKSYKIVGNIPYYITGKLLRLLSELKNKPELIVLTIQKEVAQRVISQPPKMNLLAAAVQFWAKPEIIGYLKSKDFSPSPKVESAIIKLKPYKIANCQLLNTNYYKLIKILFKQPRKTILNNLAANWLKERILKILPLVNLGGTERPQNLNLNIIKKLIPYLYTNKG